MIQSFCKSYENLKENYDYLRLIIESFNAFFEDYEINHRWSKPIFNIFNNSFRIDKNLCVKKMKGFHKILKIKAITQKTHKNFKNLTYFPIISSHILKF